MKLKRKSSARIKKRYIETGVSDLVSVKKALIEYLGVNGWAKASPQFFHRDGKVIIAIRREMIDDVRAGLELANPLIKVKNVSGTLKGLEK